MKRWHEDRDLMLRRWRMELGNHVGGFLGPVKYAGATWQAPPVMACGIKCHCARGIGTMRKQRPYDGGSFFRWEKHFDHKRRANQKRAAIKFDLNASA